VTTRYNGRRVKNPNPTDTKNEPTNNQKPRNPLDRNNDGTVTISEVVGFVIQKLLDIITLPIAIIGYILDYFVDIHKGGVKVIAAILFVLGVLISADGVWQAFKGQPFFPWSENWLGWSWLVVWLNILFWVAIAISLGINWIESFATRGKSPEQAKASHDEVKRHKVPEYDGKAINLAERYRQQYKSAGMAEENMTGLIVLLAYLFDFWMTFSSNNPWGREPAALVGGVILNVFIVFAAQFGALLWKRATQKRA
jgi:hypothetical protein